MSLSTAFDAHLADFDLADFAQEFLRRNITYRQDYRRAIASTLRNSRSTASQEVARSWGLAFSCSTRGERSARTSDMGRGPRAFGYGAGAGT